MLLGALCLCEDDLPGPVLESPASPAFPPDLMNALCPLAGLLPLFSLSRFSWDGESVLICDFCFFPAIVQLVCGELHSKREWWLRTTEEKILTCDWTME
jgi:hypothetical protein